MPFNLTGYPAVVIPVGLSRAGLPMSMQLVGHRFDEATVYRVGRRYERAMPLLAGRRPVALAGRQG
jgi:aspartyl-tRNA(Asn)/glutamyl-tRNA(Gln) amidotransferase subunit A